MSFSEISKQLRKERGISQIQLAKELNISKACISMIEIGKNEPTANTLIRYADFFQCSTDFLLGREDDFGNITIKNAELPSDELKLLQNYRSLPPQEQAQADEYVNYLAERRGNKQNKQAKHA